MSASCLLYTSCGCRGLDSGYRYADGSPDADVKDTAVAADVGNQTPATDMADGSPDADVKDGCGCGCRGLAYGYRYSKRCV